MECDRRTAASLRTSHSPPEKERIVKRTIGLSTMLATGLLTAVVASASAQEFKTRLSKYQETPLTIPVSSLKSSLRASWDVTGPVARQCAPRRKTFLLLRRGNSLFTPVRRGRIEALRGSPLD